LGPVEVVDGDDVLGVGAKERRLLARLVAARGRSVPDDVLIDVLWGDHPPPSARKTVQGHVHRLRRLIGDDAVVRKGGGYRLASTVAVDIDDVEHLVAMGRRAVADGWFDEAAEHFSRAGQRFRGVALGELEDDAWSAGLRGQLVELELSVEEERLANELARGNHRDAIGQLEAVVGRDSTRERVWCLLVSALATCGRQADALHAISRAKRALAIELGVEPGPQLRELERAVLNQHDVVGIDTVIATARLDVVEATPSSRTSHGLPGRLPAWDSGLYGRQDEIDWLVGRVSTARVVVLTGPGGIGKTRLAVAVAERLAGQFADGVYFVELAGISHDATDYAIAESVGVRREPNRTPLDSVIAWLGERDALLLLDNCEEVADAVRRSVDVLTSCCPNARLLVTSRWPVGIRSEARVPVPPLERPAALELLIDRLNASSPRTTENVRDPAPLYELCEQLDGVPLALELAAAQCRTMTPSELLSRLARRPNVLADRSGLFDDRHHDLDRLIASSWAQLSPVARRVVARLTVVIGSFTLDAAEAIASDGDIVDDDVVTALHELEDAGLVVQDQVDQQRRHRLLEPIRQHVADHLDDVERTGAEARHAEWFASVATAIKTATLGATFRESADLVELDLANFRQAHRLFVANEDLDRAVAIIDGLAGIGAERCVMEIADWCDAAADLVIGHNDEIELAALAAASRFWWLQNRVDEIIDAAARMTSVAGEPEHHLALEWAAVEATLDPSRWMEAIERLNAALAQYGPPRPTWLSAQVEIYLVLLGGRDAAMVAPTIEHLGNAVLSAKLAFARAVPYYLQRDFSNAVQFAGHAVALTRAAGATYELASTLMGYGGWQARLPAATANDIFDPLAESLDLWERLRIPWGRVAVIEEIAQALAIRGHHDRAFTLWGAVDSSGIQAPSKVGRPHADPHLSGIPTERSGSWYSQGSTMSLDRAVAYARDTLTDLHAQTAEVND
jgi:predicted ATPase/DNA-binding SARP family transcriptional activator